MKINFASVCESLGIRVAESTHLTHVAISSYRSMRSKKAVREAADRNRVELAHEGRYLSALIHDQIYRLFGGED